MARAISNARAQDWAGTTLEPQLYSALDPCITVELHEKLYPTLDPNQQAVYTFERVLQGPCMDMMVRGWPVDEDERKRLIAKLRSEHRVSCKEADATARKAGWVKMGLVTAKVKKCAPDRKQHKWPRGVPDAERICEVCGCKRLYPMPFNPESDQQVKDLLYYRLKLPRKYNKDGNLSTDKDALSQLFEQCPEHREVIGKIGKARHITKLLAMVRSKCGPDGRMHQSINVGATETGRFSSSEDCYRQGMNLSNVPREIRSLFVADPGWLVFQADLEQAESRRIAYWAQDEAYIEAHDSGNVHLWVAQNVLWMEGLLDPEGVLLEWPEEAKAAKALCKATGLPWNPSLAYYDASKRVQHGCNYGLKPRGITKHAGMPYRDAKRAYERYHTAFPRIKTLRGLVSTELRRTRSWITPFARPRLFMGRPWDEATVREALANDPQSFVADYLNIGMIRVWRELVPERVQLFSTNYDAVIGQVRDDERLPETLARIQELLYIEVVVEGERVMHVPAEVKTGKSWAEC